MAFTRTKVGKHYTHHMHSSKTLLLIIPSLEFGGAERQLVTLAVTLSASQLKPIILCITSGGPLAQMATDAGIPVLSLERKHPLDIGAYIIRLPKILRKTKPAYIHGYLATPNLLALTAKLLVRNAKIIWGIRDSDIQLNRYGWKAKLAFRLSALLSRYPDLLIANSVAGRTHHIDNGYDPKSFIVIPNGIDTEWFRFDEQSRTSLRDQWRIAPETTLIGHVGRLDPQKDHPTFLHAAKMVADHDSNVRFICVGTGNPEYKRSLQNLADELDLADKLIWASSRRDMPAVYSAMDLMVSSSAYGEGFPNVIAEAMSCGTPCVATRTGDSASIVNGFGRIVEPSNPEQLAKAIIHEMKNRPSRSENILHKYVASAYGLECLRTHTEDALCRLA